ncbi:MAG: hypothetical protein GY760_22100 [Deltaproteobacteria bacterium]|nr:hypothetical protein [Deltaproteobacteria bacterium]
MTEDVFNSVLSDVEKVVTNFKLDDWRDRALFDRFKEVFEMGNSYDLPEDQKLYLFKRDAFLLAIEAMHDVFPATEFFRKNPEERFIVFRTPGQDSNQRQIDEWTKIQKQNWGRQGEVGGNIEGGVQVWWH